MSRLTKLGGLVTAGFSMVGWGGRTTGTQTPGGGVGGVGGVGGGVGALWPLISEVTLATGLCSWGEAVIRHVRRVEDHVNPAHAAIAVQAEQHSSVVSVLICFSTDFPSTTPMLEISENGAQVCAFIDETPQNAKSSQSMIEVFQLLQQNLRILTGR